MVFTRIRRPASSFASTRISPTTACFAVAYAATPGSAGATEPFHGEHQAGIATPEQARLVFATYDVSGVDRSGLADLLVAWSAAAERMPAGQSVAGPSGRHGRSPYCSVIWTGSRTSTTPVGTPLETRCSSRRPDASVR